LGQIDAQTAWDQVKSGPRIASIDTGVVTSHEDLAGKVDVQRDYTGVTNGDSCGHGTNVAGVLAANTNNAKGMSSISWGAHLGSYIALYCTLTSQVGNDTMMANAMNGAVADGSKVISMSLAGPSPSVCSGYLQAAVTNTVNNGRLLVAAAGNSTSNQAGWPNSCSGVYSVGSVGSGDSYSSFSNYGPWVSLAAPGENITVTATSSVNANAGCPGPNGYSMCNGTSFAAPLVAAVANGLFQLGATRASVITYLARHAKAITCPYGGGQCGAGRLQAGLTMQAWHFGTAVAGQSTTTGAGYWLFDSKGVVGHLGDAGWCGDASDIALARPIVAGDGGSNSSYILFAQDGGVFNYCGQGFYGSMGGRPLNCNIVGGKLTPSRSGYWEVGCDGGIFNFGDAQFLGSRGGQPLNCAIVGMDHAPFGQGYWEVGCDGGIFNYGTAGFFGSMGGQVLNAPITAFAATASGQGYWEVARDGGIFAFGDAQFFGSMGGQPNVPPIVGLIAFGSTGYCEVGNNGALYCFGSAQYMGNGL
jgi:hypothetical protein